MEFITLGHGSGGKLSHRLISELFLKYFQNEILIKQDDMAIVPGSSMNWAISTDSFVINPIFFPGGNIGKLSVCGTVNDVAMSGGIPLYLTAAFIIEEGFPLAELERIVQSMAETAASAGVKIIAGDTKIVGKGQADGIFINTTGFGLIPEGRNISGRNAQPGDVIIVNGTLGDHGVAVMAERHGLEFSVPIFSDCAPLNEIIALLLENVPRVNVLRDPTRGGLATTLNEIAYQSNVMIELWEEKLPVKDEVFSACEILGLDPLYIANEGKFIAILPEEFADIALATIKNHPLGRDAAIIGKVVDKPKENSNNKVYLKTALGGKRILDMLAGDQLPRIC
ncbi:MULTISPECIES: hydrogenase expression/formation protein HypE [Carboxydocella]|uniref:Hydrogenase maturation protein, carbamoyl dehydratase HypE n=2 Tax=Carboxydocella TaxID=178898 RepID=A0A1T4LQQ0_9FIRM|nr:MULTISPECIES: hydrogenase expression/formation protein HypE [Carboxydocella]AVX20563.1 Hydrogenase maturation protein, carbamoyl dehydratase HypE [Carboxydocella thermautotrophica]AVX30985.1 Hydrogenase maturation protein, carbamoyl dehydratase HypE [Carboxydocella thermautotrophica]GAW31490.1 hydrogenase expression/formation protein HypE [Carboxydocella sp. JDF658]SJZ56967.1 Hydrogenase maturation protein, carbamoyl dehydratase HypE [Carboxydocella sporoproducens DSM 16521]